MILQGSAATAAARGWVTPKDHHRGFITCCCGWRRNGSRGFSTDARVIYLNSSTRRRSVVHAAADLAPLFVIPRMRQQQPLLQSLPSGSSGPEGYMPSPLAIHLKHLIQRRRTGRRSKYHPHLLPTPPLPASGPPLRMAHAVPPLPQYAATAAAAVGQQQLQQQQLFQLQDRRLLELRGGSPREGLGLAGRDVVSLSKDATAADAVSPSFAVTESLEAVAAAALHRWQEAEAAAAGLPQAAVAASERDDRPFWESLCDRIFSSRDLLPVSSLSALLRLICCRYAPRAAASVPYFLQHFYTQPLDSSRKRQRQQPLQQYRLPSQRPVTASLLLPLTREFIDDVHCISATAAANIAAIFAASNCLSIELLQLLLRRSIDTWMLPEDKLLLQRQKQQQQQKQLRQIFAVKPEAVSRFSAQEFAVFCSSLQHLLQQAQLRQPHSLLFLPLSEFLSSAASLLLSSSKVEDCLQHHAALGSLAALAADALQQLKQEQQQQQQDQLLQLIKASEVLLRASDAFVSRGEEKASEETTGGAALATAAFSSKETARLMSLLSTLRTPDSFSSPQQERQKQGKQPQELPDKVQENNSGPAGGVCADAVLQHQPGAATLLHLLQQVELELVQENSLLQQQLQLVPGQVSGAAVAYDDPSGHVKYTRMNPWEAPTVETLQLMNSVSAAIAATTTILLQPLLLERYHRNVKHPQQRRRCQRLLELLEEVGSPALAEADPSGTLVQAAARRVVRMVFAIIAAAGASLLPGAADACRALLLLLLLPPEARDRWQLQHAVTLKHLLEETSRRFAELTLQERGRLSVAVSALGITDPYIRHYCRVHGVRLQHRVRISAARRKVAATAAAIGDPNNSASEAASTTAVGTAGTKLRYFNFDGQQPLLLPYTP